MSHSGTISEVKAAIASVELSENTHTSSGSSPILKGASSPGGAAQKAKTSGETLQVGRLRASGKPKTRTESLTRKYGAS